MTTFDGPKAVNIFAMMALESALRLYKKTGMKANRAYTPKAMMATAALHTGLTFKPRDYLGAADALRNTINEAKAKLQQT